MIRIGIIGTGGMANVHATNFKAIDGVEITCCCDIDLERVNAFIKKHDIPSAFTDVDEMLSSGLLDAVTIVTPDSTHASLSIKALEAGLHVLSEKPLATCYEDAEKMVKAAESAGKINMVNLSYRNSSAWQKALSMVSSGEIGEIKHFQAHYLQSWLVTAEWGIWNTSPGWLWRLSKKHGSHGALGDVGVHILDFATGPIGDVSKLFCYLKTFNKAEGNQIGEYTLDANDSAYVTLECENGAVGNISITRFATGHLNSLSLSIHGTKGALRIDLDDSYKMIETCKVNEKGMTEPWQKLYCGETPTNYQRFIQSIKSGENDQPAFNRGAKVQKLLDACNHSNDIGGFVNI